MPPTWPATLPQSPLIQGFSFQSQDNIVRAPVELGPAKQRQRSTREVVTVSCGIFVGSIQRDTFAAFHSNDIAGGALKFSWPGLINLLPTLNTNVSFTAKPKYESSGLLWKVVFELIVLP